MIGTEIIILIACMISTLGLLYVTMNFGLRDVPHESRWNKKATPGFGGIGIMLPVLVYLFCIGDWRIAMYGTGLLLMGVLDDMVGLRADFRFIVHCFFALSISIWVLELYVRSVWWEVIFSALFIVTLINAFNFIDNMDGMASITGLIIAHYLWIIGDNFVAGILFCTLTVFLWGFNIPKAKMWMGDCGSTVLGFLLAVFYLQGAGGKPDWNALLLFSYPLIDITYITSRRLIEGKKPWMGDTNHIAHLLGRRLGESWAFVVIAMWGMIVYGGMSWIK